MASAFRSAVVLAVASTLTVLAASGCSQQGEGQRCDRFQANNTSSDCDSGLSCIAAEQLDSPTDLCCPPEGQESNERCTRKSRSAPTGGTSSGGSASSAGTGTGEGGAGEPAGGSSAGTSSSEDGGTAGSGGLPSEAGAGGTPVGDAGTPGVGGAPSAGAPTVTAGQGGAA